MPHARLELSVAAHIEQTRNAEAHLPLLDLSLPAGLVQPLTYLLAADSWHDGGSRWPCDFWFMPELTKPPYVSRKRCEQSGNGYELDALGLNALGFASSRQDQR